MSLLLKCLKIIKGEEHTAIPLYPYAFSYTENKYRTTGSKKIKL